MYIALLVFTERHNFWHEILTYIMKERETQCGYKGKMQDRAFLKTNSVHCIV